MTISTTTLKNAARAIECDLWNDSDGANYLAKDGAILRRWEPETSSADSFSLLVSAGIDVEHFQGCGFVRAADYFGEHSIDVDYTDDRLHDYRVAVLLCAAEIGAALCQ